MFNSIDISNFIPVSGCVGISPIVLLYPGPSNTVKTTLCIGGVLVSVLTPSVINHEIKSRCGQIKHNEFGICCFSTKHAASNMEYRPICLKSG
jgi:hypothetical protein